MGNMQKYDTKQGTRWRVRYRTPDNRDTAKSGFKTKREAELWYSEYVMRRAAGTVVPASVANQTFGQLLDRYLSQTARLAPTTVSNRESIAANWIRPDWNGWPVSRIKQYDVKEWIERISSQPRAVLIGHRVIQKVAGAATAAKAHAIFHAVLQDAVTNGIIGANPASHVGLPKSSPRPHPYLSYAELIEFVDAFPAKERLLVLLLGLTGLRFGEAAAIRKKSVWIDRRRIRVEAAVTEDRGKLVWGVPKDHEIRTVPLPHVLLEPLRQHIDRLQPEDLVFTSSRGETLRLNSWRRRTFATALAEVNRRRGEKDGARFQEFPRVTPHDLRHTAASLAVSAGANVKVVQKMLGHASANLTLDTYADLFDTDLDDVAERMTRQFEAAVADR